jgi:hypothetical protein
VILPGLPTLSTDKLTWSPIQRKDLLFFWQEIARALNANAASTVTGPGSGGATIPVASTGSFTPNLLFGGAGLGITYTSQFGYWQLITTPSQQWVNGYGGFVLSSKGTSTGTATVSGLPFACGFGNAGVTIAPRNVVGPIDDILGYVLQGASAVSLWYLNTGATVIVNDTNFNNTSELYFPFNYRVS